MPTSNSRLAYDDCYELLNQALDDEQGVRAEVISKSAAVTLRTRLHTARRIDRDENAKTYKPEEPMHGKSVFDVLQVKLREYDDRYYVYLEKITMNYNVESLSEVRELEAPEPLKLISPPKSARRV